MSRYLIAYRGLLWHGWLRGRLLWSLHWAGRMAGEGHRLRACAKMRLYRDARQRLFLAELRPVRNAGRWVDGDASVSLQAARVVGARASLLHLLRRRRLFGTISPLAFWPRTAGLTGCARDITVSHPRRPLSLLLSAAGLRRLSSALPAAPQSITL
jgi:hypothetical protein